MTSQDSLVSWIDGTRVAVALAKDTNEANRRITDLEDAKANLAHLLAEFQSLVDGARVARMAGWSGWTPSPGVWNDFRSAAKDLDPRPVNRLVTTLDRATSDIRLALVDAWGNHVRSSLGDIGELLVLASTLSDVDGVSDLSRRLRDALQALASAQKSLPSKASVDTLTRAEGLLAELEASLQPPLVRQFLSSVAHGGASVDLLSADVIDWLRMHNAVGSFKVVAGAPVGEDE